MARLGAARGHALLPDCARGVPRRRPRPGDPAPRLNGTGGPGAEAREHNLRPVPLLGRDQPREGGAGRHHEGPLGQLLPDGRHRRGAVRWQDWLHGLLEPCSRRRPRPGALRPARGRLRGGRDRQVPPRWPVQPLGCLRCRLGRLQRLLQERRVRERGLGHAADLALPCGGEELGKDQGVRHPAGGADERGLRGGQGEAALHCEPRLWQRLSRAHWRNSDQPACAVRGHVSAPVLPGLLERGGGDRPAGRAARAVSRARMRRACVRTLASVHAWMRGHACIHACRRPEF
mmetsp:Transcript_142002/g.441533  ORF Transcript_142002/g.441533 Transcript_142002/m.441533 type:complete len:289 (-) Transcript_142002:231-1097(-)